MASCHILLSVNMNKYRDVALAQSTWRTVCCKATWRNWWERRGACTHCGQLNEYPMLPTPPSPLTTPPSPKIFFSL